MSEQDAELTITLTGSAKQSTPAGEVTIPRELGSVRLVREIGRGGMGVVYLGRHQMLDRDVAVKFLLNAVVGPDDPDFAGFLEGARAAARLEHPGLTTIHHADVVDGIPYLVMQYVDGPALSDVLKQSGPLSLAVSFAVLGAVLEAIGELHDRGIIHRDIKPGNVMLGLDGRVVVTDFGLALVRPMGQRGPSSARLGGTPVYMAPEMFAGELSLRSDVYALGVMTFELLAGELPFTGTFEEVREKHLHEPLPIEPLHRRGLDPALIEVLERATRKNAMFRYKTARHFRTALKPAIMTDELLRKGAAELQRLVTRALDTEPDATTTEAAETTPTSTYFDRLAEIAEEKRATRELSGAGDAHQRTRDDRAEAPTVSPGDRPVERGSIPGDRSTEAATLVADVPCVKCEYNLRGLPAGGRCPECGESVTSSLRPDRLQFADRVWLRRIARGLTMIHIAIPVMPILVILVGVTGALLASYVLDPVLSFGSYMRESMAVALVAGPCTLLPGIFFSTAPEPRLSRGQLNRKMRWTVRTLAVLFVSILTTAIALRIIDMTDMTDRVNPVIKLAWGLTAVAFSGLVLSFLLHLSSMADRVPDRGLARKSRYLAVLLGLLVILNVLMPSGLVVFTGFQDVDTWFGWMIAAIGIASAIALVVTVAWIWVIIGAYRRGVKRAVAACVSYDTLFGDVPTEVALPSSENERVATRTPRTEIGETGAQSTDVDEVSSSDDIPCIHCGYNLRGLPEGSRCPECGTPIARSLRGDLLSAADPAWLQRVYRGQALVYAGCVALVAHFLLYGVSSSRGSPGSWIVVHALGASSVVNAVLEGALSAAAALLVLLGVFTTTTLDPRLSLTEQPIALRRFVRGSIVALVVLAGCSYLAPTVVIRLGADADVATLCGTLLEVAGGLAFLSGVVGICYYLAAFAMRIPDARLATRTRSKVVRFAVCIGILILTSPVIKYADAAPAANPLIALVLGLVLISILILALAGLAYTFSLMNLMSHYRKAFRKALLGARKRATAQDEHI